MKPSAKERGLSQVAVTVWLVVLTVVVAALVFYIAISNILGFPGGGLAAGTGIEYTGGQTPLTASLTYLPTDSTATKAVLQVTLSTPPSSDYTKVRITLKEGTTTGAATLSATGAATVTVGGKSYSITVLDLDGNGKLSTGDKIIVDGGTNSVGGIAVIMSISGYAGNAQVTIPA